jgi:hypothetical protein
VKILIFRISEMRKFCSEVYLASSNIALNSEFGNPGYRIMLLSAGNPSFFTNISGCNGNGDSVRLRYVVYPDSLLYRLGAAPYNSYSLFIISFLLDSCTKLTKKAQSVMDWLRAGS